MSIYRLARSVAFRVDAERVHHMAMAGLRAYSRVCDVEQRGDLCTHPSLERVVCGVRFRNPLGLAAGFDKDARCIPAWHALGFGFVEVGTVTRHPQPGNDTPRLFRLPNDDALLNRLGFNNRGAVACATALRRWRDAGRVRVPIGVNIGKSKITPADEATHDYAFSFDAVCDVADYVVVNVSSPNTPGLRDLQQVHALRDIVVPLVDKAAKRSAALPLFVKLAPDLSDDDAIAIAAMCQDVGVSGLVVSNTTISRDGLRGPIPDGPGGISGKPLFARSTALLSLLSRAQPTLAYMGVGGVFTAEDARRKIQAGASLVQAYSGFVYRGPGFARDVVRGLTSDARPALSAPPLLQ